MKDKKMIVIGAIVVIAVILAVAILGIIKSSNKNDIGNNATGNSENVPGSFNVPEPVDQEPASPNETVTI